MLQGGDFAAVPELGYEEWRAVVRSIVGRYNPEGTDPNAFAGKVHVRSLFGLCADRWDHNAHRIERTQRDVRLDAWNSSAITRMSSIPAFTTAIGNVEKASIAISSSPLAIAVIIGGVPL
jgi:hypothetical protein